MPTIEREDFGDFSVLHRTPNGGEDITVHFAHATGFNAETYRPLLESMDPTIDLRLMDARGHGRTTAEANPRRLHSWDRYRRDLQAYVESLRQPVVLAGHSMGGTVSMQVAAKRPDLVRGLVLIDPVIFPPRLIPLAMVARTLGFSRRILPIVGAAARRRTDLEQP